MKTVTHIIITHALFLALFGGAALALAQEDTTVEAEATIETTIELETDTTRGNGAARANAEAEINARRAEIQESVAERQEARTAIGGKTMSTIFADMELGTALAPVYLIIDS